MKKLQLSVIAALLTISGLYVAPLESYPYGYSKLYRDETDTLVDIVYDAHVDSKTHTGSQFHQMSYDAAKSAYWPSEYAFLEHLEVVDRITPCPIDLLWESYPYRNKYRALLIQAEDLIKGRLKNMHLIHSDTWRHDKKWDNSTEWFDPIQVTAEMRNRIDKFSGTPVLKAYETYATNLRNQLKIDSQPFMWKTFCQKLRESPLKKQFNKIADPEILGNILASDKRRIIVYVGGAHCEEVRSFLLNHGYRELHHHEMAWDTGLTAYPEIPLAQLSPLKNYHTPRVPYQPSSATTHSSRPAAPKDAPVPAPKHQQPVQQPAAPAKQPGAQQVPAQPQRAVATQPQNRPGARQAPQPVRAKPVAVAERRPAVQQAQQPAWAQRAAGIQNRPTAAQQQTQNAPAPQQRSKARRYTGVA